MTAVCGIRRVEILIVVLSILVLLEGCTRFYAPDPSSGGKIDIGANWDPTGDALAYSINASQGTVSVWATLEVNRGQKSRANIAEVKVVFNDLMKTQKLNPENIKNAFKVIQYGTSANDIAKTLELSWDEILFHDSSISYPGRSIGSYKNESYKAISWQPKNILDSGYYEIVLNTTDSIFLSAQGIALDKNSPNDGYRLGFYRLHGDFNGDQLAELSTFGQVPFTGNPETDAYQTCLPFQRLPTIDATIVKNLIVAYAQQQTSVQDTRELFNGIVLNGMYQLSYKKPSEYFGTMNSTPKLPKDVSIDSTYARFKEVLALFNSKERQNFLDRRANNAFSDIDSAEALVALASIITECDSSKDSNRDRLVLLDDFNLKRIDLSEAFQPTMNPDYIVVTGHSSEADLRALTYSDCSPRRARELGFQYIKFDPRINDPYSAQWSVDSEQPAHGIVLASQDDICFIPEANWTGEAVFNYNLKANRGVFKNSTIHILVNSPDIAQNTEYLVPAQNKLEEGLNPSNLGVLYNTLDPDSREIAEYYIQSHQIPAENMIPVTLETLDKKDVLIFFPHYNFNEDQWPKWGHHAMVDSRVLDREIEKVAPLLKQKKIQGLALAWTFPTMVTKPLMSRTSNVQVTFDGKEVFYGILGSPLLAFARMTTNMFIQWDILGGPNFTSQDLSPNLNQRFRVDLKLVPHYEDIPSSLNWLATFDVRKKVANYWDEYGSRPTMALAGFTKEDVFAMIDRGVASRSYNGTPLGIYMDNDSPWNGAVRSPIRNADAQDAVRSLAGNGKLKFSYLKNQTASETQLSGDLVFYSMGLTYIPDEDVYKSSQGRLQYAPGALADHLTSFGGLWFFKCPMAEAYEKCAINLGDQESNLSWLKAGATASYGTIWEPGGAQEHFPKLSVLWRSYIAGDTAVESYWKSLQRVGLGHLVGDPLARSLGRRRFNDEGQQVLSIPSLIPKKTYSLATCDGEKCRIFYKGASAKEWGRHTEILLPDSIAAYNDSQLTVIEDSIPGGPITFKESTPKASPFPDPSANPNPSPSSSPGGSNPPTSPALEGSINLSNAIKHMNYEIGFNGKRSNGSSIGYVRMVDTQTREKSEMEIPGYWGYAIEGAAGTARAFQGVVGPDGIIYLVGVAIGAERTLWWVKLNGKLIEGPGGLYGGQPTVKSSLRLESVQWVDGPGTSDQGFMATTLIDGQTWYRFSFVIPGITSTNGWSNQLPSWLIPLQGSINLSNAIKHMNYEIGFNGKRSNGSSIGYVRMVDTQTGEKSEMEIPGYWGYAIEGAAGTARAFQGVVGPDGIVYLVGVAIGAERTLWWVKLNGKTIEGPGGLYGGQPAVKSSLRLESVQWVDGPGTSDQGFMATTVIDGQTWYRFSFVIPGITSTNGWSNQLPSWVK